MMEIHFGCSSVELWLVLVQRVFSLQRAITQERYARIGVCMFIFIINILVWEFKCFLIEFNDSSEPHKVEQPRQVLAVSYSSALNPVNVSALQYHAGAAVCNAQCPQKEL